MDLARGRVLGTFVLSLGLLGVTVEADARDRTISGVEVRSLVPRKDRDLAAPLKASVERELSGLDLSGAPRGGRYVLSVSLTKLDTSTSETKSSASCRVSVTLRDAKRGSLHAFVDGSALAEDAVSARARAEDDAIAGAVKGALRSLPEVMGKLERLVSVSLG